MREPPIRVKVIDLLYQRPPRPPYRTVGTTGLRYIPNNSKRIDQMGGKIKELNL